MESELEASIKDSILAISQEDENPFLLVEERLGEWFSDANIIEQLFEIPPIDYSINEGTLSESNPIVDYFKIFYNPEEDTKYVASEKEEVIETAEHENFQETAEIFEDVQLDAVTSSSYLVNQENLKKINTMIQYDYGRFIILTIGSLTNDINYSPLF